MRSRDPARVPTDGAGDCAGDPERGQALPAGSASRHGDIAVARASTLQNLRPPLAGEGRVGAQELVLVLDFGSQYSQLIARRVREAGVYCELIPGTTPWEAIRDRAPSALILSGGPASVYEDGAPRCDPDALNAGVPVLGICYGMQLLAYQLDRKSVV